MQTLLDLLPIIVFFAVFKLWGIYPATAALIVVTLVMTAWLWLRERRVSRMQLITAGLVLVFGGLTLWLQDETFVKWKPTVAYWLFAAGFLGSALFTERSFAERLMGEAIVLRDPSLWRRVNLSWVLFFLALGGLNLYVAYRYPTETWVDFKLFGLMGLTLLWVVAQAIWLTQHAVDEGGEHDGDA